MSVLRIWLPAGSDLLGQTVAALASIAIVFQTVDAAYANTLEAHARDLYVYAVTPHSFLRQAYY